MLPIEISIKQNNICWGEDETMKMRSLDSIKSEDEAHEYALDWQTSLQDGPDMSYGELAVWQAHFEELAIKFNLTDEFKENAII